MNKDLFHTVDFYGFGREAGEAWRQQYQERYLHSYLEHMTGEIQTRLYHLARDRFPGAVINAWEKGFRDGAMG